MPPKAVGVPRSLLEPALVDHGLTVQDVRVLYRRPEFLAISSRNEQLIYLRDFAPAECDITLRDIDLAEIFEISPGRVTNIRARARKQRLKPWRPLTLDPSEELRVIEFILARARLRRFVTPSELIDFVEKTFAKAVSTGWVMTFTDRHKNEVRRAMVRPQEDLRLQTPREYLTEFIRILHQIIPRFPREFIFNADETGLSDWEERRSKLCIVPAEEDEKSLHYSIDRRIRHQTLLCAVSAGGDAYAPMIVTSERKALGLFDGPNGLRNEELTIKIAASSYMTTPHFESWLRELFLPVLSSLRSSMNMPDQWAVLFMDNCSAHTNDRIMRLLSDNKIVVISYPPHTSGIFQILDLLLFGVLKRKKRQVPKDDTRDYRVDHIFRIYKAYEATMTTTNIRSAWTRAGLTGFKNAMGVWYLRVDESAIRATPAFREVWEIDYPIENVTTRRRASRWGILNKGLIPPGIIDDE